MPLPALYQADMVLSKASATWTAPQTDARTVILSGSCSAMTNAQVAAYIATGAPSFRLDPLELSTMGARAVLEWLAQQDFAQAPLIYATADPTSVVASQAKLGVLQAGALIEGTLANCAIAARDAGARRVLVAGGETSGAVTQALRVTQLDIANEIVPGVPWTYSTSGGHSIALALKSGNFGSEHFFADAKAKLSR